ncbi:ribonuclease P protein subunit p40-like [Argiope bruennichi]|uniref:ribonuclease P protein subunit p40-like n=1 Tax=Argiope bruennichi TaxID=94029 RepID=UPI0024948F9A|nr:ribonuclease P protein subunit p40-like [Argiope bruennichi]
MFGFKNVRKGVKVREFTFDALKEDENVLNNFPIYCLHIFIPGPRVVDETCTEKIISPNNVYFIIKQVTVSSLIKAPFLEQFVKCGSLQAFSYKSKIRQENFIALLPTGKLILYLKQNFAQNLLIKREPYREVKKSSKRQRLDFQTFVIDTKLPSFVPGKKPYNSIWCELNKLNDFKFDLLLKWNPEGNICPQSVRVYFENEGYKCITCESQHICNVKPSACMPDIDISKFDSSHVDALMEWIGMQICGISLEPENSDTFLFHDSQQKEHLYSVGKKPLKINMYEGFFDIFQVRYLLEETKKLFEDHSDIPFIVVSITGYFESFTFRKELKFSEEDKMTTLLITPDLKCWVIDL